MKKKGHAIIPDFSHTRPARPSNPASPPPLKVTARPPAPAPTHVNPQATSAKSGRRGQ